MHQGKRLQSIAAFRINEGLTSWPLSPIYLLLWARYRSSTKRSPSFFRLVNGQTALTADTALRLAKAFRTTPAFWMGLQARYDIERAQDEIGGGILSNWMR